MVAPNPLRTPLRRWGNPGAWFTEGRARKAQARREGACVECRRPLASRRSPYCSRLCQWRFCGHYFWDSARSYVMRRDRYTCQHCHRRFRARELDVDHIVELARGGPEFDFANLQTLCRPCHRTKTAAFLRDRCRSPLPAVGRSGVEGPPDWFPA